MTTTNKGLAQPTYNSETNTWGTTSLNNNFGYLDQALGGSTLLNATGLGNTTVTLSQTQCRPATLAISGTPGGIVTSGLAMYDTMQYVRPEISTVCVGQAASMGSFLLTAGTKGKRYALPNARIMVHQPSGGAQGQATDIEIQAREILNTRARLNAIYVKHTGQTLAAIEAAVERDRFMSPEEAKTFGLIDQVMSHRPSPEEQSKAKS